MNFRTPILTRTVCLTALALSSTLLSLANAAYLQRFSTITNGAITFTGNTLGLSKTSGNNAQGTNGAIGTFITTDTSLQDIVPAPTGGATPYPFGTTNDWTKSASAANLSIPTGSTVLYAELIWSGSYAYGGQNVSASLNTPVKLTAPDGTVSSIAPDAPTSTTLGANSASTCTTTPCFYVRSKNVTSIVQAKGAGSYTVGGVPATEGNSEDNSNNAGWTLAVVYQNFGLPARNLTLFVGAEQSGAAAATVSGFCTPVSGARSGRLLVSASEGDAGLGGDRMKFGPTTASLTDLFGPNNPVGNFFASQINSDTGALDTSGTFGSRNHNAASTAYTSGGRQGWDITNVDVSSTLGSGQTSASAQGTTSGDAYVINALALQINVGAPSFPTTVKSVDKASAVPGDVLTYTVRLDNRTGTSDATNVVFTDTPPPGTSFVANSLGVDGVVQSGANPSSGVNIGTVTAGTQRSVSFKVQVNTIPAAPNPARFSNTANWTYQYISCAGQPVTNGSLSTDAAITTAPRLEPVKTVSPTGTVRPNDLLTYTINVPNTGLANTSATTLLDAIPTGTTYVAGSTTLNNVPVTDLTGGVMPFTTARTISSPARAVGQINATETATVQFQVRVNPSTTGTVTNTATIDLDGAGPLPAQTAPVSNTVQPTADLKITKIDTPDPVIKGNTLTYTLDVVNNGPSSVTGATVNDTLPVGLNPGSTWLCVPSGTSSCTVLSGIGNVSTTVNLQPGAANKVTITITGTVLNSAPNMITNTATVTPPGGVDDLDLTNNTATANTTVIGPDLTIDKSHTDPFTRGSGGAYSVNVTNSGSSTTSAPVTVVDTVPVGLTPGAATGTGWTCNTVGQTVNCSRTNAADTLAAGASLPVITIPVTVDQTAAGGTGAGSLTNSATVAGGGDINATNNTATDPTAIVSSADVKITKTGPASIVAGNSLAYTITVTNAGPSNAVGVNVTDPTPTGLTFVSNTGDCTSAFSCALGTVAPGAVKTITVTYTVPPAYTTPDPIVNTASVSSSTPDPASGSNTATANTSLAAPVADLSITKTDVPASTTAIPGTSITYQITVTNAGPSAATGATVTDTFPATITGVTWTCTASAGSSCPATGSGNINTTANVLNGGTLSFLATGTISSSATGNLVNTASVTPPAGVSDPTSNNNTDANTLVPQADVSITKTGPASVTPGTNAVYTITVTNAGPSNAASVSLDDPTPAGLNFVSNSGACTTVFPCDLGIMAPSETRTITATYAVPANYSGPATITNTASVSSPTNDPTPTNNSKTATTSTTPSADLSLTKTVDNSSPEVGQNIKYTVTLTNAGPSVATRVSITDQLSSSLQFVSSTATQGAYNDATGVWTLGTVPVGTRTLEIIAKVVLPGAISNAAQVTTSTTPDPDSTPNDNTGDDSSSVNLTARAPDLTVTKTHTGNFVRGGTGAYTITATNSGTAPTNAPVTLSDALPAGLVPSSVSGTGWACTVTGQSVNCTRNDVLPNGASYPPVTVNVNVSQSATSSITNVAGVSGGGEFNAANSSASDPTSIVSSANLDVQKIGPTQIVPGQNAVFTITVFNAGPSDASNVVVTDPQPSGLSFVSSAGACVTAFPCSVGTVQAGQSKVITVTYAVPANYATGNLGPDPIANTASATSSTPDPDGANNASTVSLPIAPSADLQITKLAPASVTPGSSATFTITLKNNGPSDATSVSLTDPTPVGLSFAANTGDCTTAFPCNLGTTPSGATRTITATYNVPSNYASAALGPDPISNTATATSTTPDPNGPNSSTATVPIAAKADLSLTKTVAPTSPNIGSNVTYTVTLTNAGPSVATDVTVADALPAGLTFVSSTPSIGAYAAGVWAVPAVPVGTHTLQIIATVTGSGAITNTAEVTASSTPDPDSTPNDGTGDDRASVSLTPLVPDLTLEKTHTGSFVRGTTNAYTIQATNAGTGSTIAPVTVTDTLPAGLTPGAATGTGWTCNTAGQTVSCSRTNPADVLATGSSFPGITIPVTVDQTTAGGTGAGALTNTANVSGGGEVNTANSSASDPTAIASSADVKITKTGPASIVAGNSLAYTITVTNAGPSNAVGVNVTDPTPTGLSFASNSGACTTVFPCALGTLAPGATRTITATYTVPPAYTTPDPIVNTASVSSSTPDPASGSDSATANTSLNAPIADLSIAKTDVPASPTAIPGTSITYQITVTNAGPSAAIGARVVDNVPAAITGVTWTCAPTAPSSCAGNTSGTGNINTLVEVQPGAPIIFTLTGTIAANATGNLVNTASVTPPAGVSDPTSNNNTDANTLVPQANLSLTKTGPASLTPGTNAVYTITVTNAGPSNAASVSVDDPTPAGLNFVSNSGACMTVFPCDLGIMAPSETRTITATYAVPAGYNGASPVTNTATVSSPTTDPDPSDNAKTLNVPAASSADLSVTKTVDKSSPIVGDTVKFTVTLTNAGPSDATAVTVTDALPAGLAYLSSNPSAGAYNAATGAWTISRLAPGNATLEVTARVTAAGSITNTAQITASGTPDPNTATGNTASVTLGATAPDLTVTKTHTGNFTRGVTGAYTITVKNAGTSATNAAVNLTDTVPVGLVPTDASGTAWTCTVAGQDVNCTRGDALGVGASYPLITINVQVEQGANSSLTNTVTASGGGEINTGNSSASDPTSIVSSADLSLTKTIDKPAPNVGDLVVYTVTLTNAGPSNAVGVAVTDQLPSGLQLVSSSASLGSYAPATGAWTLSNLPPSAATLEITARVTGSGSITNTAEVTASSTPDPDSTPGDGAGDDRARVTLGATAPDLTLTKSHTGSFARGSSGVYAIDVKNSGNGATIAPVTVTDTIPAGITPNSANGVGWDCTINLQIVTCTRSDVLSATSSYPSVLIGVSVAQNAAGGVGTSSLTNTASASGGSELNTTNNTASDPTSITSSADLSVVKTGLASLTPGLPVTYTIKITNDGPSDAKSVSLNDPTPTGLVFTSNSGDCTTAFPCALGDLASGETRVIQVTYDVPANYTNANLGPDPVVNIATASSAMPDPNTANSSATVFTPIAGSADLQVSKTGPASITAGTNLTFTIKVTNAGPSDALNVKITDPTPPGLTFISNTGDCTTAFPCALGTLTVGQTRTISATYAIPATYTTPDPVQNTAIASSDTPDPESNNSSATASSSLGAPIADLGISKTDGSTVAVPGAPITYTITVTNAGPSAATGARVVDTLPATIQNATWACTASAGSGCSSVNGAGDLDSLVTVLPNGIVTFTLSGTVSADATGVLINTASVTPPAGTSDPSSANNTDLNTLTPSADLSVNKSGPASLIPGTTATYTISVKNNGPSNAANVTVTDPTPAGLVFVSNTGDCTTVFPCNLGLLAPNATRTITATYSVPTDYSLSGGAASVTNTVSVSSPTTDPGSTNNSSSATVPVQSSADLSLVKTVDNSNPLPGDTVTFTINLSNAGPSDAANVRVREQLPAGLAAQSITANLGAYDAGTGIWTLPRVPANSGATLTVIATVTASGPVQNTAEVISSGTPDPDSTPADGRGDDISSVTFGAPVANLSITKTNNTSISVPGAPVTYTITARNTGPDSALGANVTDAFLSSITGVAWTCAASAGSSCAPSGTGNINAFVDIAPNGTVTFTATGTVSPSATGVLSNTAHITPPPGINDPGQGDNAATDTDSLGPQADLEIIKTGPASAIKNDRVTYTMTVKNDGPSSATNVTVTDGLPLGLSFISGGSSQGSCAFNASLGGSGTLRCDLGSMSSGSSVTVTLVATVTGIGAIANTATASSATPDPNAANNTSTATTTVGTLSDLKLEKTHAGTFSVGENGVYKLSVSNIGAAADPGLFTVVDTLPVGLSFVSGAGTGWTCTANAQVVTCTHAGPLAGGASLSALNLTVKVGDAAFPAVTNEATVSSPLGDSNPSNNTARDATGVTAPVLALEKTAAQSVIELGGTLGFTLKVRNNGAIPVTELSISDTLPIGLVYKSGSSTLEGTAIPDPQIAIQNNTQVLTWPIPAALEPATARTIRFATIATPQLPDKPIINTATAQAKAGPLSVVVASNVASAMVKTSRGVFTNNGVILGRVYFDKNDNNSFEDGVDEALEGARVYLTDGRYAITDALGRYNFTDLKPGQYAVRLDPLTVPFTPKRVPDEQGLLGTRLVRIEGGGISTEDFLLEWDRTAIIKARSTRVTRGPVTLVKQLEQGGAGYAVRMTITLSANVANLEITDPLPPDATRGPIEFLSSDGKTLTVTLDGDRLRIDGVLEAGTYTLQYALFTPLPPESVVTDPSIGYEEVIR